MSDEPAPAATVLLLRDTPSFEVLMVERHQAMGFAGGALAFPGGRVDPGDRDPAWTMHADGLAENAAQRAAQIAAIREAFEEIGILLARDRGGRSIVGGARSMSFQSRRKTLSRNVESFLELIRSEGLVLACDTLQLFAHWVAPPGLHRRFDTLFFAAPAPLEQEAVEDGDETTESLWITPSALIAARACGARKMIFPTARNVELLALSSSVSETLAFAKRRKIVPIQPELVERRGEAWLTIPEGLGYPVIEERLEKGLRG